MLPLHQRNSIMRTGLEPASPGSQPGSLFRLRLPQVLGPWPVGSGARLAYCRGVEPRRSGLQPDALPTELTVDGTPRRTRTRKTRVRTWHVPSYVSGACGGRDDVLVYPLVRPDGIEPPSPEAPGLQPGRSPPARTGAVYGCRSRPASLTSWSDPDSLTQLEHSR